ncbi:putative duf907 domain protein [Neofusicoccum parvum UCRNP2]|uniref:Putative duf907 domain protein n=1 Tax=Botryosphaeria parva (strain UCR-NP2) TaxID=1287680 RepID=R1FWC4_BOTPV|nr:putative duf907 domain protein [Neofusicoccum parvum UCRNP2]
MFSWLVALVVAAFPLSAAAEQLIKSNSLNPCMANSGLSATLFNVVFTPANRSLAFNIVGVSDISGNVTAELDVYAYGLEIFTYNLNPCENEDLKSLCPMNTGQIPIDSNAPLDEDTVSQVPGIAYTVPDLDGLVQIRLSDAESGKLRACVEADLSNGKTVYQKAAAWTSAIIVGSGLTASAIASGLGHSYTATHVATSTMSLFGYFQSQAYIGMAAVDLPPIAASWTQNFQWSMGIIRVGSFQTLATWYQRATGGTASTLLSNLGTASVDVQRKLFKRTNNAGSSDTSNTVTLRGIERVGFRAGIEPTNIFLTGYIIFIIFFLSVTLAVCLFRAMLQGLAKKGKLKDNQFQEFRERWSTVLKGILFRITLIGFPQMVVLCFWELWARDSSAEVVLAVFTLVAMFCILARACFGIIQVAKTSKELHHTPAYLLFSNAVFLQKWGALYSQFRAKAYFFMVPILVFSLAKGMFIALGQDHGKVQAIGLLILELGFLVVICILRPYMNKKINALNISIAVFNLLGAIFLLIFTEIFNQPGIVTGVSGVVFFIYNAAASMVLLIMVLLTSFMAIISKNPDERYHPIRDDRASFMKSNSQNQLTTELDALGVTARNETTIPSPFKLGPLDQLVNLSVPIAVVFTYKSGIAVERLQRALARLLDYYPHLTGRLRISEEDGTREMTALGSGAELLVAECTSRLDAFSSPVDLPGRGGNALCAPFDPSLEAVCRDPQFTIQHTRFACGAVALGVRLHHTLCDSDGFFQLVRDLAELYRSIGPDPDSTPGALAHPPCIRGYLSELLYDMPPDDRKAALEYQPSLFHVDPTPVATAAPAPPTTIPTPPPVVGRIIRITGAELAALKAHATNPNGASWISTFDALAAHLWQTLYRARLQLRAATSPPLSTAFLTSVNHRARLAPPPRHFPNCLFTPYCTTADLATAPLWQLAQTMHALTRTPSAAAATATVRWIAAQPDKRRIRWGFPGGEGAFMFSAWSKFDAYHF